MPQNPTNQLSLIWEKKTLTVQVDGLIYPSLKQRLSAVSYPLWRLNNLWPLMKGIFLLLNIFRLHFPDSLAWILKDGHYAIWDLTFILSVWAKDFI